MCSHRQCARLETSSAKNAFLHKFIKRRENICNPAAETLKDVQMSNEGFNEPVFVYKLFPICIVAKYGSFCVHTKNARERPTTSCD